MVAPSRFLRLELLSVRSRDRFDLNYIKLPADTMVKAADLGD
jgi:hypothetical protein